MPRGPAGAHAAARAADQEHGATWEIAVVGASVAFRVAPGIRVVPELTGPRSPFGPLLRTRGAEPPDVDRAELARWRERAGGGRAVMDEAPPSAWTGERAQLQRLLAFHTTPVVHAGRPVLDEPTPVRTHDVRVDLRARYLADVPRWNLRARRAARGDADAAVPATVEERQAERDAAHAAAQAAADAWWHDLGRGEARASLEQLEAHLRAALLPAAATAVDAGVACVVAGIDTPETLIGRREPVAGNTTGYPIALLSDRRRNRYYLEAVSSLLLAISATAFAVVPGLRQVNVAVVGLPHAPQPYMVAMAELPRESVLPDDATTPVIDNVFQLTGRSKVRLAADVDHETAALTPLPVWDTGVATALNVLERP